MKKLTIEYTNKQDLVEKLFKEVKKAFSEASDSEARKILKEIRFFQNTHFSM